MRAVQVMLGASPHHDCAKRMHGVRDAVRAVQVMLGASPHHDCAERMHGVRDAVRAVQVMLGASPHHDCAERMHGVRDAVRAVQVMLGASPHHDCAERMHGVRNAVRAVQVMFGASPHHVQVEQMHGVRDAVRAVQVMLGARPFLASRIPVNTPCACASLLRGMRCMRRLAQPGLAPSGFTARAVPSLCPPFPHPAIPSLCPPFLRSALPNPLSVIPSMCPPFLHFARHSLTPPFPLSARRSFALPCHSPSLCPPSLPFARHSLTPPSPLSALRFLLWPPFPISIRPSQGNSLLLLMTMVYSCPDCPATGFTTRGNVTNHRHGGRCPGNLRNAAAANSGNPFLMNRHNATFMPSPTLSIPSPTLSMPTPPRAEVDPEPLRGNEGSTHDNMVPDSFHPAPTPSNSVDSTPDGLPDDATSAPMNAFTQKSSWNIIKVHLVSHYIDAIRRARIPEHWCAQLFEHLHIEYVKNPYRASNKRNAAAQVMNSEVNRLRLQALAPQLGKRKRYDTAMLHVSKAT
ncbi:unnamed protein product [Closterium sp. NIES-64]|nr:unnamed protein product [Closterium sp. NIES-64]